MNILQTLNHIFWFNILTRCPLCHKPLMKRGFGTALCKSYKCECGWGATETYGAWNNPNVKVKGEVR